MTHAGKPGLVAISQTLQRPDGLTEQVSGFFQSPLVEAHRVPLTDVQGQAPQSAADSPSEGLVASFAVPQADASSDPASDVEDSDSSAAQSQALAQPEGLPATGPQAKSAPSSSLDNSASSEVEDLLDELAADIGPAWRQGDLSSQIFGV